MGLRRVQLAGEFNGFEGETVIRTVEGEAWQQSEYLYHYHYDFMPNAILEEERGRTTIQVTGVPFKVPVVAVSIELEGTIVSKFQGFKQGALFQFDSGQVWQQTDSTYSYEYFHRPDAYIVCGLNGVTLSVDGMSEAVQVRRVR